MTFKLVTKIAIIAAVLLALNPRMGGHSNGSIYVLSCNLRIGVSVGQNGIGYTHFPHENRFTDVLLRGFGC